MAAGERIQAKRMVSGRIEYRRCQCGRVPDNPQCLHLIVAGNPEQAIRSFPPPPQGRGQCKPATAFFSLYFSLYAATIAWVINDARIDVRHKLSGRGGVAVPVLNSPTLAPMATRTIRI